MRQKGHGDPAKRHDLFEDLNIPLPIAFTAIGHLAVVLIGCALIWVYRRDILAHLGKVGMTLLVLGLALLFLFFVLNIALIVSRLLLF
jgi:hypothetical protein